MQQTTRPPSNQPNRSTSVQANRTVNNQSRLASPVGQAGGNSSNHAGNINTIVCRRCKSPQIVANKKGYNFASLFITLGIMIVFGILLAALPVFLVMDVSTYMGSGSAMFNISMVLFVLGLISLFLALPVGILVGFAGRSTLVNGCMNCGYKWTPGSK
ncbi:hypothetical protein [Paenibacillus sp. NPDC058071]|uniref:hypothetical protein n=1 Tax=Paenibacillus sp. NPDC058071 TaxID=3346326 RepID=UPI0036D93CC7